MILEGIVTTLSSDGSVNVAPMGPMVDRDMHRLLLRPFPSTKTFANLKAHPEGVFHVSDDVLLLARAAVGRLQNIPPMIPAHKVRGFVLADSCRYYEFRIVAMDESEARMRLDAQIVHSGHLRDFLGFNRAKHAVVEVAILATRVHLLPAEKIQTDIAELALRVHKTGGPQEIQAFELLSNYIQQNTLPNIRK